MQEDFRRIQDKLNLVKSNQPTREIQKARVVKSEQEDIEKKTHDIQVGEE